MNFSTTFIIFVLMKLSVSYPVEDFDQDDSNREWRFPISLLNYPPMEVDLPNSVVEYLPGSQQYYGGTKAKRNQYAAATSENAPLLMESCCPTVLEKIHPFGAMNRSGNIVQVNQEDGVKQVFYEISCDPSYVEKPCRYLDRRHSALSKCVQQYSYTYAVVRDFGVNYENVPFGGWRFDYIQVRSGCACHVSPRSSLHSS